MYKTYTVATFQLDWCIYFILNTKNLLYVHFKHQIMGGEKITTKSSINSVQFKQAQSLQVQQQIKVKNKNYNKLNKEC